ncbi:hypothetical protein I551_3630 [Mycobacterium ulcerans str. Harvey]|uniref:Uncharacterized protein n=1 Tax=Mycobacterium ulcerans str. Harvey TaxID=1299332 RepID=A0ABN0QZ01_MYCUL|nr:hypothetical protein I551_3630 [Mycobacterium ulcerans str. Harvey]
MTGPPAIIGATVVTPPVMSLVGGATGGGLVGPHQGLRLEHG